MLGLGIPVGHVDEFFLGVAEATLRPQASMAAQVKGLRSLAVFIVADLRRFEAGKARKGVRPGQAPHALMLGSKPQVASSRLAHCSSCNSAVAAALRARDCRISCALLGGCGSRITDHAAGSEVPCGQAQGRTAIGRRQAGGTRAGS